MKLAIGSDHAGYPLKVQLLDVLRRKGHEIQDYGSYDEKPVDFPDIAKKVTAAILSGEAERGIMFCGTGVGAAIACNKVRGIRASVCHDLYTAHQCVEHDDVQIIALGARRVMQATGGRIPVGYVTHAAEMDPVFEAAFGSGRKEHA